jgi:hypothetical protein
VSPSLTRTTLHGDHFGDLLVLVSLFYLLHQQLGAVEQQPFPDGKLTARLYLHINNLFLAGINF